MAIGPLHSGSKNHELSIFIIFSPSLLLNPSLTKGHGHRTTCNGESNKPPQPCGGRGMTGAGGRGGCEASAGGRRFRAVWCRRGEEKTKRKPRCSLSDRGGGTGGGDQGTEEGRAEQLSGKVSRSKGRGEGVAGESGRAASAQGRGCAVWGEEINKGAGGDRSEKGQRGKAAKG
ncbi:hypothetical protein SLA2020_045210 [Shorea laevis]